MRRLFAFALLCLVSAAPAAAQQQRAARDTTARGTGQTATIRVAIDRLFDAMRAGDSTAVRATFAPQMRLMTVARGADDDSAAVRETLPGRFAAAVGAPRESTWDERVWDVEIRRDGPLAAAWVPYAFFVDDEMSHCGTNAIQLARLGGEGDSGEWKIVQITDTRRSDCMGFVPADVRSAEAP